MISVVPTSVILIQIVKLQMKKIWSVETLVWIYGLYSVSMVVCLFCIVYNFACIYILSNFKLDLLWHILFNFAIVSVISFFVVENCEICFRCSLPICPEEIERCSKCSFAIPHEQIQNGEKNVKPIPLDITDDNTTSDTPKILERPSGEENLISSPSNTRASLIKKRKKCCVTRGELDVLLLRVSYTLDFLLFCHFWTDPLAVFLIAYVYKKPFFTEF